MAYVKKKDRIAAINAATSGGPKSPSPGPSEADSKPDSPPIKNAPFSPRDTGKPGMGSITVRLNPDGSPDIAELSPKFREKLEQFLRHPTTLAEFHLAPANLDAPSFDPMVVQSLFQTIGLLRSRVYESKCELPRAMAETLGSYSQQQLDVIVPLTQKVLAKHSGEFLAKWNEEISLVLVLVTLEVAKFRQAMEMADKIKASAERDKNRVEFPGSVKAGTA